MNAFSQVESGMFPCDPDPTACPCPLDAEVYSELGGHRDPACLFSAGHVCRRRDGRPVRAYEPCFVGMTS